MAAGVWGPVPEGQAPMVREPALPQQAPMLPFLQKALRWVPWQAQRRFPPDHRRGPPRWLFLSLLRRLRGQAGVCRGQQG